MKDTVTKLRNRRGSDDRGFTLIELLVVVVIIGVLVAIAIPVYLNYTKGAQNKSAQSDVRNAVLTVELCYSDNDSKYPTGSTGGTGPAPLTFTGCTTKAVVSPGNLLSYSVVAGPPISYTLTGCSLAGGKKFVYTSATGLTAGPTDNTSATAC